MSPTRWNAGAAPRLRDRRASALGPFKWVGNDYVRVTETADPTEFLLAVVPVDTADAASSGGGGLEGSLPAGDRLLIRLRVEGLASGVEYGVDGFYRYGPPAWHLTTPWGVRGLLLTGEAGPISVGILPASSAANASFASGVVVVHQGRWHVAIVCDEDSPRFQGGRLRVHSGTTAIAVDIVEGRAVHTARELHSGARDAEHRSRDAWDAYLTSCPVVHANDIPGELRTGIEIDADALVERQLWHWWVARVNVARSVADCGRAYVAPDRSRWHGTWSSDGPITLSALALTSDWRVAEEVMIEYIRASINASGFLSWYTHADGAACLARLGDTGAFSHGVPDVVRAVEFMDRHGDSSTLLDANGVGDRTVYETLAWYLESSDARDGDGDGLWETAHLWESGWDNKVGPLFSSASLADWVEAIGSGDPAIIASFADLHSRPVVSMAEQFNHLMALGSLLAMALRRGDLQRAHWCREKVRHITTTIESRQWNEETSTYRDWDVRQQGLSASDCLDGFYYLAFERRPDRVRALLQSLRDPARFGLIRSPTLSRDDPAFNRAGYWDGSHWPREMHYLALGLARQGERQLALRVLMDALMSADGCQVLEHVDSVDGSILRFHGGAVVCTQAMSIGLCLGLLDLVRGDVWWPDVPTREGSGS
jgi:hypothetical protein